MTGNLIDVGYLSTCFHLLMFTEAFFTEGDVAQRTSVSCPESDT